MTPGERLVLLLDAWAKASPGGLRGRVSIGFRASDGFRFWTVGPGRGGRPETRVSAEPDPAADARLCLTSAEAERLLAGGRLEVAEHRRFVGDPAVLGSFADQLVRQLSSIGVRAGAR